MPPPTATTPHHYHAAPPQPYSCISMQCEPLTNGESDKNNNEAWGCSVVPICSSPTSNRKKRNKVSFSDLSPQEIEPPPSPISSSFPNLNLLHGFHSSEECVPLPTSKILGNSPLHHEQSNESLLSNVADLENECLMDIVEEILAGNITIDQCLDDLVAAKFLSDEEANSIAPRYRANAANDSDESAVDKLIEVFSKFSLGTLLRCRKHITRKLCRLSSVEEYESAQKAAANALRLQHDRDVSMDDVAIEESTGFETTRFDDARTSTLNERSTPSKMKTTISFDATKLLALLPGLSSDVEAFEIQSVVNVLLCHHCGNKKRLRSSIKPGFTQTINGCFRVTSLIKSGNKELDQKSCSLEDWCRRHHLSDQTTVALRRIGFSCPASLRSLSEESIEQLTGLSWLHKARLWLAIGEISTSE